MTEVINIEFNAVSIQAMATITILENCNLMTRQAAGKIYKRQIDEMPDGDGKEAVKKAFKALLEYCECPYAPTFKVV